MAGIRKTSGVFPTRHRCFLEETRSRMPYKKQNVAYKKQKAKEQKAYKAFVRKLSSRKGDLTNQERQFLARLHWSPFINNWRALFEWNPFDDWYRENSERIRALRRAKMQAIGDQLTERERILFENRGCEWIVKKSEIPAATPYFPSTPYQKLPENRSTKLPPAIMPLIEREPLNLWPTTGQGSTVTTYDGEFVCLFIRWRGNRDEDLAVEFKRWAGKNRPEKFKDEIEERRPSGKAAPERQAAVWLRKLGACRLFARYANLQSVPEEFRDVWYRNPVEMRESCISLDKFFHERLQFLDESEKPECLTECERKGRFNVKCGRPRKV